MQVRMRGKLVGVEKAGKSRNKDSFIHLPDSPDSVGVIRHLSPDAPSDIKLGDRVVYGDKRTQVIIDGQEILVMESENVVAVITE